MSDPPDAEAIDGIPGDRPLQAPNHRPIWIRLGGAWYTGDLFDWVAGDHGERWAWIQHDRPDGKPWPTLGLYRYSKAIVSRAARQRPPDTWRWEITPEDAAPFLRPGKDGTRNRHHDPLPPCPGCGCTVERAFGDRTYLHVVPCQQRMRIWPPLA